CEPDRIDAQRLEVVQPLDDALQVTRAAALGVLEAPGRDLVDDRALPPLAAADPALAVPVDAHAPLDTRIAPPGSVKVHGLRLRDTREGNWAVASAENDNRQTG